MKLVSYFSELEQLFYDYPNNKSNFSISEYISILGYYLDNLFLFKKYFYKLTNHVSYCLS
jgi:hypothetical protein